MKRSVMTAPFSRMLCISLTLAAALGGTPTLAAGYSQPYGKHGNWEIYRDPDNRGSCFAHNQASQTMLRLVYESHDDSWEARIALWGETSQKPVRVGFGKALKQQTAILTLRWARISFSPAEIKKLRSESTLVVQAERGPEKFSLAGSSKAMDMVRKCATSR